MNISKGDTRMNETTKKLKTFRIDDELEKMCLEYCEENHISFTALIERALLLYVHEHSTSFDSCNS